ncbi:hypothetical protein O9992_25650 [Vibrio lentus]|nr:hypothetical protein [Vibrio lentus]
MKKHGADIRCFVVGNKVIAAMKRQAGEGGIPALTRTAAVQLNWLNPTKEERATARSPAKIMV